jgi:sulfatase modifying factor 1
MRNASKITLLALFLLGTLTLQASPQVQDLNAAQRTDATRMVDIYFNIIHDQPVTVSIYASQDNGVTWNLPINHVSGDVGPNISPGNGKHIVWNVLAEHPNIIYDNVELKVIASDGTILTDFIIVQGGTFTMGDTRGVGSYLEYPVHQVTVSTFYIGKYEVTQFEWANVMGSNPASDYGVGNDYPVYNVSWYSAIKYCNLRSITEGLTPVYSISGTTNPVNWGAVPTSNNATWDAVVCNWSANGFRLPTEAEWEYAARGATNYPNYLYAGSDDVNAVSWYRSNSGLVTHLIGTKNPNGLGIFDMSGNVLEWCWDWYSQYSSTSQNNPTGPSLGSYRIGRGGEFRNNAWDSRITNRYPDCSPSVISPVIGLRLCRNYN